MFLVILAVSSLLLLSTPQSPPHLLFESAYVEYDRALRNRLGNFELQQSSDPFIQIIQYRSRFEEWRKFLNVQAQEESASERMAWSPDFPMTWGPKQILNDLDRFKSDCPQEIVSVLTTPTAAFFKVDEWIFSFWYESFASLATEAARWILLRDYLPYYTAQKKQDVRPYYFLSKDPDVGRDLQSWASLTSTRREYLQKWLPLLCFNSKGKTQETCEIELMAAVTKPNGALDYYSDYLPAGRANFDSFFSIPETHPDFSWNIESGLAHFRLVRHSNEEQSAWFQEVLESFYHFDFLKLAVEYRDTWWLRRPTRLFFKPGTTAHVNRLAGTEIHFDSLDYKKEPIVAAHEFGHILGLPDCYIEFYEPENEWMLYYAIDRSNFMCSLSGQFLDAHRIELKKSYDARPSRAQQP